MRLVVTDLISTRGAEIPLRLSILQLAQEYLRNASLSGQPGVGDAFVKWVFERQASPRWCQTVKITPDANRADWYRELPEGIGLERFDPPDRKFIAVAFADEGNAEIWEAADTKWLNIEPALRQQGITVRFLCRTELARLASKKKPRRET